MCTKRSKNPGKIFISLMTLLTCAKYVNTNILVNSTMYSSITAEKIDVSKKEDAYKEILETAVKDFEGLQTSESPRKFWTTDQSKTITVKDIYKAVQIIIANCVGLEDIHCKYQYPIQVHGNQLNQEFRELTTHNALIALSLNNQIYNIKQTQDDRLEDDFALNTGIKDWDPKPNETYVKDLIYQLSCYKLCNQKLMDNNKKDEHSTSYWQCKVLQVGIIETMDSTLKDTQSFVPNNSKPNDNKYYR